MQNGTQLFINKMLFKYFRITAESFQIKQYMHYIESSKMTGEWKWQEMEI